ncbi:hypothetical protein GCM10022244_23300 [Streptomyces gulbargensis]|uniref:Uncharacterized protein n=1 Tax=Streptomyces gulbargensis TaxID=364901 RepID=A0ABP7M131_9ACTN
MPELRTDTDRSVAAPDSDRDRRPETERREVEERDEDREEAREELRAEPESGPPATGPAPPFPGTATPVGTDRSSPPGATTGASPHVSQYSSPPPTSSYDPSHEGR